MYVGASHRRRSRSARYSPGESRSRGERGQALILMLGGFTVILVVAAIVIDFGLWMAERRSMQRAADLAVVAAAQELLVEDWATVESSALAYAEANGYISEPGGVLVTVEPRCRNQFAPPLAGICANLSAPASSPCVPDPAADCDSLRVTISKPSSRLFTSIFGIGDDIRVGAGAAAGVQLGGGGAGGLSGGPQQTMILLDAAGRMQNGCASSPGSCPMTLAKDEVHALTELLLNGAGGRQVGYAAFTYCYEGIPAFSRSYELANECITEEEESPLTDNAALLDAAIAATHAHSGAEANLCLPLYKALLTFPLLTQQTASRAVVLFSDGDNRYDHSTYFLNNGYPPLGCRPALFGGDQPGRGEACSAAGPAADELQLDLQTYQAAQTMKNVWDIDVVVVALNDPFWGCLDDDGNTINTPSYCDGIGVDNAPDRIANQRLLKCMASSAENYILVSQPELGGTAETLGTAERVALLLANRGLLQ